MYDADLDKPVGRLSVGQCRRLVPALLVPRPPQAPGTRSCVGRASGRSRSPHMASTAGTRPTATRTANSTVAAAAGPITVSNGIPVTADAAGAVITVAPAKATRLSWCSSAGMVSTTGPAG